MHGAFKAEINDWSMIIYDCWQFYVDKYERDFRTDLVLIVSTYISENFKNEYHKTYWIFHTLLICMFVPSSKVYYSHAWQFTKIIPLLNAINHDICWLLQVPMDVNISPHVSCNNIWNNTNNNTNTVRQFSYHLLFTLQWLWSLHLLYEG